MCTAVVTAAKGAIEAAKKKTVVEAIVTALALALLVATVTTVVIALLLTVGVEAFKSTAVVSRELVTAAHVVYSSCIDNDSDNGTVTIIKRSCSHKTGCSNRIHYVAMCLSFQRSDSTGHYELCVIS